jgi:hypothetical protein
MMRLSAHIIVVLAILLIGCSDLQAQDSKLQGAPARKEFGNVAAVKDPGATDVWVDGYKIDKRAAKYYHPGQLTEVSRQKAEKINEIYISSFELLTAELSKPCLLWISEEFELGAYNHLRKWDTRVEIEVQSKLCNFRIALHSWSEINSLGMK